LAYCVVRSRYPLRTGLNFFEIHIDYLTRCELEHGWGIANSSIDSIPGWHQANNGIGWYSNGTLFDKGTNTADEQHQIPTWKQGDTIALLVELTDSDPYEWGTLVFFKNKNAIRRPIAIEKDKTPIYATALLNSRQQITLTKFSRSLPSDYNNWNASKDKIAGRSFTNL